MALKTFSQIVQTMVDNLKLVRPTLDTKPGTVSRDLFIDLQADQLAKIYSEIAALSKSQSFITAVGSIMDQYGANFGVPRDPGRKAVGKAILTFDSLTNNISILAGSIVSARNGAAFKITANINISVSAKGAYASFATKISSQLNTAGITDQYAIEVPLEAIAMGTASNVATYSIIRHSIPGITNITNIEPITGGTSPQTDSDYRAAILAALSGSNVGTSRGYTNSLLSVSGVEDVLVVEPGDPILSRDGTISQTNSDGTSKVIIPGTGGKVDVWVKGKNLIDVTEAYTYNDLSGKNDPTNPANDYVIGQTTNTKDLSVQEKRAWYIKTGELANQPVDAITSLIGSLSGANFIKDVNYALQKDTNPESTNTGFATDKLIFLKNYAAVSGDTLTKAQANNQDGFPFSNIRSVSNVKQDNVIINDLAYVDSSDSSKVNLSHAPIKSVLRIVNLTTGERYIISNQNIDANTGLNETGSVYITGNVLPSISDRLQVDYIWVVNFDSNVDYFDPTSNKSIKDVIDWGRSNNYYFVSGTLSRTSGRYRVIVDKNADRVANVFSCLVSSGTIQYSSSGYAQVALTSSEQLYNVFSIIDNGSGIELYNTKLGGSFSVTSTGTSNTAIINIALDVPKPAIGDAITIYYNSSEYYNIDGNNGSIANADIILSTDNILSANGKLTEIDDIYNSISSRIIYVNYIATDIDVVSATDLALLPFAAVGSTSEGFVDKNSATLTGRQPISFSSLTGDVLRLGPSYLGLVVNSAPVSGGAIGIRGTGWFKMNLSHAIQQTETAGKVGLSLDIANFNASLSASASIAKVASVALDGTSLYINGYQLLSNIYDQYVCVKDLSLSGQELDLSSILSQNNLLELQVGQVLSLELYIIDPQTQETINFTSGTLTLYSANKYSLVDRFDLVSGFDNSGTISGTINITRLSQPISGTTYNVDYTYTAPVNGERLTLQYRYNRIIQDCTDKLETVRPLTADVLTKLANVMLINVNMEIIVDKNVTTNVNSVLEQVTTAVTNVINTQPMGATLDDSDLIRVAANIVGVNGVTISVFDYVGSNLGGTGKRNYIISNATQYMEANLLSMSLGSR